MQKVSARTTDFSRLWEIHVNCHAVNMGNVMTTAILPIRVIQRWTIAPTGLSLVIVLVHMVLM